jgi:3-hydroxyacyl-[acyl-carrier-protein] dehydratase
MPAPPLFDMSKFDAGTIIVDKEGIRKVNPQRYEFEQLDGIVYMNHEEGEAAGVRDVRADEFWVPGHLPGRPLFPGALMIETAAQLVGYYVMSGNPEGGFMGFGGVDNVKFRGMVLPGRRIVMLGKEIERRKRRIVGATQGYVDGKLVYEGVITGMWF